MPCAGTGLALTCSANSVVQARDLHRGVNCEAGANVERMGEMLSARTRITSEPASRPKALPGYNPGLVDRRLNLNLFADGGL
jgi:hypothetical protein